MKLQILPNWCKKLGLTVFIVFSFIAAGDDFVNGFCDGYNSFQPIDEKIANKEHVVSQIEHITTFKDFFGAKTLRYLDALSILGILMYMLSKEKVEDDYINQLRLESYQLTAIVGILISIVLYAFSEEIKLTIDYFVTLFMYFYLITFFIKKRIY
ncbi:hypothetical protein MHL31_10510 [Lutibacter sp. A80]|uniref:hypothetical protein n=1 Tax=Lutibacter sp. A80 TaxID=2918453 RepID=UPI001F061FEB|nr:hypothetical protein [Lutibacter sp. A80]UMB59510.1 hypothetical protein MHL31_10510 [Lutibacter sp. A80]